MRSHLLEGLANSCRFRDNNKQFRLTAKSAAGFHNNERKVQCYNHCSLLCIRRLLPDDISSTDPTSEYF